MKQITIRKFLSTGLRQEFNSVVSIDIDDKPFSEGAFGEVYFCRSINGRSSSVSQIIKIFKEKSPSDLEHNYETIKRLQKKLNKKNTDLLSSGQKSVLEEYPAFKGVPQFSFSGILNGKKVKGYSADNLKELGFVEFKEVLEDDALLSQYQGFDMERKLLISYHFVSAFKILREFYYIHADLKPEALFVNMARNECAIIDYDSGVITESPNDEPNTWGAANDWVAPEIWDQLKVQNPGEKIKVDLNTDSWSVTIGVHYFLTTIHPLFFLTELSPRATDQYFRASKWPEVNKSSPYFNKDYLPIYDQYYDWINSNLPQEVKDRIAQTINYGYKEPIKRTKYDEWQLALLASQKPPVFLRVGIDKPVVIEGVENELYWEVDGAHTVLIEPNIGKVPPKGTRRVTPTGSVVYKIKAIGHFGETTIEIPLKVFPTPVMETLLVPSPDFTQVIQLSPFQFSTPKIDVSIKLKTGSFSSPPDFEQAPIEWAKITPMQRSGSFFLTLSNLFHEIRRKIFGN
jgi:serine/threonine protein kinase